MNSRGTLLTLILCLFTSTVAMGDKCTSPLTTRRGFIKADVSGHPEYQMYFEYTPAKPGKRNYVLVHGMAESSTDYAETAAQLKADGEGVLVVDLLLHGRSFVESGGSDGDNELTASDQGFAIDRLMNKLDIKKKVHLVGHSIGGMVVYLMAAMNGGKDNWKKFPWMYQIEKVHLVAPYLERTDRTWMSTAATGNPFFDGWMRATQFATMGMMSGYAEDFNRRAAPSSLFAPYLKLLKERSPENGISANLLESAASAQVQFTMNMLKKVEAISENSERVWNDVPFQVIFGSNDKVVPPQAMRALERSKLAERRDLRIVEIPGASHFILNENPRQLYQAITRD